MTTVASAQKQFLEMRGMSFSGVRALDGVSFDLYGGENYALVAENGAGKMTLMKILGGAHSVGTYEGTIIIIWRGKTLPQRKRSGTLLELDAITACVIGGASLLGDLVPCSAPA